MKRSAIASSKRVFANGWCSQDQGRVCRLAVVCRPPRGESERHQGINLWRQGEVVPDKSGYDGYDAGECAENNWELISRETFAGRACFDRVLEDRCPCRAGLQRPAILCSSPYRLCSSSFPKTFAARSRSPYTSTAPFPDLGPARPTVLHRPFHADACILSLPTL